MRRSILTAVGTAILVVSCAATASAQLDPLLFLKRVPPNVIILVDNSMRMLEDGNGFYYDPREYTVSDDTNVASLLGVSGSTKYRRKYKLLSYTSNQDENSRFQAMDIVAVSNSNSAYASFYDTTRIQIAKQGIAQAVGENLNVRWGFIKTRQKSPAWRATNDCDKPVDLTSGENAALKQSGARDTNPCSLGGDGKYGIFAPKVDDANFNQTTAPAGTIVATPGVSGGAAAIATKVTAAMYDASGLIPAGRGTANYHDRPIAYLLEDAKWMLTNSTSGVFIKDSASTVVCRNTVVVLIAGGKNDGDGPYLASHSAVSTASTFTSVSAGSVTSRVPIYVVGVKPAAADETELQQIATNSGGSYYNVSNAADLARIVNLAVQTGFSRAADFQAAKTSEFTAVSPIIGTVNIKGGLDSTGATLTNDEIHVDGDVAKPLVPQRSNVLVTAGFGLPGFDGRIRAFRVYVPVSDTTKPSGWKFVNDGTKLWPDLDGRPALAGLARTPVDPNTRNIYTYIPNDSGGGSAIAFTTANIATLKTAMNVSTDSAATTLIDAVRAQPLGAVIGSTPALMDPPSLDPPPDDDYGYADGSATTFAGQHTNRRSIIFVGANDGMIHAIDARTGYEIWAFIPYNLLPKLKTLLDGQPVEQFDYFVDSSPKIAEVKMNMPDGTHKWRSLVIIGEGPGGTFYQAFDVTEAGMNVDPTLDSLGAVNTVLSYFDAPNESIKFLWSFPRYRSFNTSTMTTITGLTDATPGGTLKMYGDIDKDKASYAEKTVGFTWSDPAVGPLDNDRNVNAVMVGSGYFPDAENSLPGRGATAPRAGRVFYLVKVDDGTLLGNSSGASCAGIGCIDVGDVAGTTMKNALQADPSAAGDNGAPIVKKAYMGDLDGKYWRFDFGATGAISKTLMLDPSPKAQPIFSSSALLFVGSADVYMFFATGSDLLPASSAQGTGTFQLYALKDNYPAAGASTKFTYSLTAVTNTSGNAGGERASAAPSVAGDIVFYTTNSQDATAPCSDFTSNLYAFTYLGGAAYDSTGDNKVANNESPRVKTVAGRATAPFIVDQHLYFGTAGADGVKVEAFGDPQDFNNGVGQVGVRILSWREIR